MPINLQKYLITHVNYDISHQTDVWYLHELQVLNSKSIRLKQPTCANKSIVRRNSLARSPSSIAQSIIISLQVRPEAQASTIPEN